MHSQTGLSSDLKQSKPLSQVIPGGAVLAGNTHHEIVHIHVHKPVHVDGRGHFMADCVGN